MDYSTFQANRFYIKKDSTLPKIKFPLIQQLREKFDITDDMLENVGVTFSMIDSETGLYKIANVPASLNINRERAKYPDEVEYTLSYNFKKNQTKKAGNYEGEFVIDFLGEGHCGKIKLPINNRISIVISDTITNTTVI